MDAKVAQARNDDPCCIKCRAVGDFDGMNW
jgi:hypothetical protein